MYTIEQILRGLKNPRKIFWELYSYYSRRVRGRSAQPFFERDWDNLIILDACRYDLFAEENTIKGDLEKRHSMASNTREFFQRELTETYPGTVYLTANPNLHPDDEQRFHRVVRLWETDWDEDLNTAPPDQVAETALETASEYPNKRLVVHFVQPHRPFIGDTGRRLSEQYDQQTLWQQLNDGTISIDGTTLWNAYRENLRLALPHVERLVTEFEGKTVVTSDHGNAFGEYGVYGHPARCHIPPLVTVPWLTTPFDTRKTVTDGELGHEAATVDSDAVSKRLADLGYVE